MLADEILYNDVRASLIRAGHVLKRDDPRATSFDAYLDLLSDISNQNADFLLYCGSGVTKSAKQVEAEVGKPEYDPPEWFGLLERIFQRRVSGNPNLREEILSRWRRRYRITDPTASLLEISSKADRLQLAWLIGELFHDRNERDDVIRSIVQPQGRVTSDLITQLRRLPTSVVVTTSYDSVLEATFRDQSATPQPQSLSTEQQDFRRLHLNHLIPIYNERSLSESFNKHGLKLFYLHGAADRVDSPLVLDRYDYAVLMSRVGGLFDQVTYLLRGMPAIYVGFGLDDPSFNFMENVLYSYDSIARPISYAFVEIATPEEHCWWRNRNLRLIEYGNHEHLPFLIKTIADTRRFICWAEPNRPPGANREDNRTQRYFEDFLNSYSSGDYQRATLSAREALASTVFWGTLRVNHPVDREPISDVLRLVDIRIRLGLSHHKQRTADPEGIARAKINCDTARELLEFTKTKLTESDTASGNTGLLSLENSNAVLDARIKYSEGEYAAALHIYNGVCDALADEICHARNRANWNPSYTQLNAIAVYAYAECQASRIRYQLEPGKATADELRKLNQVVTDLAFVKSLLLHNDDVSDTIQKYFDHTFATLIYIARWFAGRHCLAQYSILPLPSQLRQNDVRVEIRDHVTRAIEYLDGTSPSQTIRMSSRWMSLRSRYLARAFSLKWLADGADNDGLSQAYKIIGDAIEMVAKPDLRRSRVVTHLEAARVGIMAAYGAIFFQKGLQGSDPNFALMTSTQHLMSAVTALSNRGVTEPGPAEGKDRLFLLALAARLRAYVMLLAHHSANDGLGLGYIPSFDEIVKEFADPQTLGSGNLSECTNDRYGLIHVSTLYKSFGHEDGLYRIERFLTGFRTLDEQLSALTFWQAIQQ